ncbi:MAG: 23S rRNA (adenine(2503)-C(2))-methyltransferase RlmN [Paludibacteraceae bacterium]|nr:23S rRNA (adenine(2503)-C(2))-methyltransferase RlmN [Paludibacteraceae bacterium]
MENLFGKTKTELKEIVEEMGLPRFAVSQICDWLYKKRVKSIDGMTNISVANREKLKSKYEISLTEPVEEAISTDGTKKYLFKAGKGYVEAVYIPDSDRATLCVSSQVGCKMNCLFCMTGKQGFTNHLTAAEILNQIQMVPDSEKLTNLVFMGMGEPFDNTLEVLKALDILTSDYGYAMSPRRITVSTVGIIPGMTVFLEKSQCHLAVSLHNPFEKERAQLMPVQKKYSIIEVLEKIKQYDFAHQRRVSFEYIMFNGVNDSIRHAHELVNLLKDIPCRVNLIRFHAIPNVDLKGCDDKRMLEFQEYLNDNGIICTIRKSRGEDILAACGMLSTKKKECEK